MYRMRGGALGAMVTWASTTWDCTSWNSRKQTITFRRTARIAWTRTRRSIDTPSLLRGEVAVGRWDRIPSQGRQGVEQRILTDKRRRIRRRGAGSWLESQVKLAARLEAPDGRGARRGRRRNDKERMHPKRPSLRDVKSTLTSSVSDCRRSSFPPCSYCFCSRHR